ncbi:MAG: hypothetical protein H0X50_06020 [Nitrosopumilus sp.]|nr:hypothetical protein [Nitrosopumilus sp.]
MQRKTLVFSVSFVVALVSLIIFANIVFTFTYAQGQESYQFVKSWGEYGSDDGKFYEPNGIAIDSSDNVNVADSGNDRIQKFDNEGNFITKWGSKGTENVLFCNFSFYMRLIIIKSLFVLS